MANPITLFFFYGLSVLGAILFAVYPLPVSIAPYRPEILCLFVVYWILYAPYQVGVGLAWCLGLFQDVVEEGVWGGHAIALALVAYIALMAYRRLRTYSLAQQTFWVFIFVGIHQFFVNWIEGFNGYPSPVGYLVGSAVISALCWPVLVFVMLRVQRHYHLY